MRILNPDDLGVQIVTPSQTISRFGFSRCIIFAMHLDIYYVHTNIYVSRKIKTTNNLGHREYLQLTISDNLRLKTTMQLYDA